MTTIEDAYKHEDPYNPKPIWDNFRGLFRAVNTGSTLLRIPAYNGGLFAEDPILDSLAVPDEVCGYFRDLAGYHYGPPHDASYDELDETGKQNRSSSTSTFSATSSSSRSQTLKFS